jgi:hypothetical protein
LVKAPMKRLHPELVAAMRATDLPAPQERGLWYIARETAVLPGPLQDWYQREYGYDAYPEHPAASTTLCRWTDATIHTTRGECVMSDDPRELRRHLPIVLAATGRVLITGLGLGCVVRGLLARGRVQHVDVVELDAGVLEMVGPSFQGERRVTLHHGDALAINWPPGTRWDFAWHDVWNDRPETQVLHAQLLVRYRDRAERQGAWGFPREVKRLWGRRMPLLGASTRYVGASCDV